MGMTADLPGGLRSAPVYEIPAEELPALAELLSAGREWAKSSGIPLAAWLVARAADIEAVAEVVRKAKRPDVVATTSATVATVAPPLHPGKLEGVVPFGNDEVGLAQIAALIGVTRQAVLGRVHRHTLPARKDDRGRWLVPRSSLEAK